VPPATELPLILSQVSRERYLSKVQGMVTQLLTQSDPAARAAQLAYVAGLAYEARILSDAVSLMFAHLQRELNPAPVPADEPAPAPQERRKARGA
jgi:hypothetical protein